MPYSAYAHAEELNAPCTTLTRKRLKEALYSTEETAVKAMLHNEPLLKLTAQYCDETVELGQQFGHVWVSARLIQHGFNEAYLNTAIIGKRVFAPYFRGAGYLPTCTSSKYAVFSTEEVITLPTDNEYREVQFTDETMLAELYCNAYKYNYLPEMGTYAALPELGALQNAMKTLLMKEIMLQCGDPYERTADLSRIVLFLLSKVTLTATEQNILSPLLSYVPGIYDLAHVAEREKNVQALVAVAKANPQAFIK